MKNVAYAGSLCWSNKFSLAKISFVACGLPLQTHTVDGYASPQCSFALFSVFFLWPFCVEYNRTADARLRSSLTLGAYVHQACTYIQAKDTEK